MQKRQHNYPNRSLGNTVLTKQKLNELFKKVPIEDKKFIIQDNVINDSANKSEHVEQDTPNLMLERIAKQQEKNSTIDNDIKLMKVDFYEYLKNDLLELIKELPLQIEKITTVRENLIGLNDHSHASKLNKNIKELLALNKDIKSGKVTTRDAIYNAVKSAYKNLKNFQLEENHQIGEKEENLFKTLKPIIITADEKSSYKVLRAPLVFYYPAMPKLSVQKMKTSLGMSDEMWGYPIFKKAMFIILNKNRYKKDRSVEGVINSLIMSLNEKVNKSLIPIHDVSLNLSSFYIVWVAYEEVAREINDLIEKSETWSIMIEIDNNNKEY